MKKRKKSKPSCLRPLQTDFTTMGAQAPIRIVVMTGLPFLIYAEPYRQASQQ